MADPCREAFEKSFGMRLDLRRTFRMEATTVFDALGDRYPRYDSQLAW
jgi:hypothetical protein